MSIEDLRPIFLQLPTENIVYLKFVLESYEGLGIIRTMNAERGEVVILALPDTVPDLEPLLQSLAEDLSIRFTGPPDDISEDWLLSDSA